MPDANCYQTGFVTTFERRQDRLEEVADRLTNISADLSKMIAVHEQRLNQQERQLNSVEFTAEKRREEFDEKLGVIFKKIDAMRTESIEQDEKIMEKINDMEKTLWRYGGAFAVLAFILAYGPNILKILDLH